MCVCVHVITVCMFVIHAHQHASVYTRLCRHIHGVHVCRGVCVRAHLSGGRQVKGSVFISCCCNNKSPTAGGLEQQPLICVSQVRREA
jgi:hypothetical protein